MVRLQNLKKYFETDFGRVAAVDDVSLELPPGRLLTLLGPSGCGKTTTLRCIAGLEQPDEGIIKIGEDTVFSSADGIALPAYRRRIGMVFQSYAIWPHMSVFENVAFPLDGTGLGRQEVKRRVEETLDLVGLLELAQRPAPHLSGGQQQRVALARALVAEPEVLLLDEPLSNLDAKLRVSMRSEIRALQQRLGITTVYVTHDQQEALAISDLVVVMSGGRMIEMGAPGKLYERPKSRFTAEFIGTANVMPVHRVVSADRAGVAQVDCPFGKVELVDGELPAADGGALLLMVRPEHVEVESTKGSESINVWPARVRAVTFLGNFTECVLDLDGHELLAQIQGFAVFKVGQDVSVRLPQEKCTVVRDSAAAAKPAPAGAGGGAPVGV